MAAGHNHRDARKDATVIEVRSCGSIKAALALEKTLIDELHPQHNRTNAGGIVPSKANPLPEPDISTSFRHSLLDLPNVAIRKYNKGW